jgi:hypothetical protein
MNPGPLRTPSKDGKPVEVEFWWLLSQAEAIQMNG